MSMIESKTSASFGERYSELRLQEAEHRHADTLQLLSNLVRRSLRDTEGEEAREALASVSELVDTLSKLHKLSRDREDDLGLLLEGMCRHWQRLCNGHIRLVIETQGRLDRIRSSQTVVLLIVQELVLNAVKHAFPGNRTGTIHVALSCESGAEALLQVEDDGAGVSHETGGGSDGGGRAHHGTALVRDLSLALGGDVRAGPGRGGFGHCVTVRWPL